jgi:hypothetical protein
MKRTLLLVVCGCLSIFPTFAANGFTETIYQSYNPADGLFDLTQSIGYVQPDPSKFGPGPYPVFIYVPGTYEGYEDPLAQLFVTSMVKRGFLSASVAYSNNSLAQSCPLYKPKAQGIFDSTRSTSATATVCSLSSADCSKGIVTSGISQGGFIAVMAKNYDPRVQAVYALSMSDYAQNAHEPFACVDKQNTSIPANRVTIVNGISDPAFTGQQPVQNVSGFTCPDGSYQCWSPDNSGAGWYVVQNWQVVSGKADHCYFMDGNKTSVGCVGIGDPNWLPPAAENWSFASNMAWLASMGTSRTWSQDGY